MDEEKATILEAIAEEGSSDEKYNRNNGVTTTTNVSRTAVYSKSGGALSGYAGWIGYFRPLTK